MVRNHGLPQADFFTSRETWPRSNERPFVDIPQERGFGPPATPTYPMPVETALRDYAQIPAKEFVLVVLLEDGGQKVYTSTSLKTCRHKIVTERFLRDFSQYGRKASTDRAFSASGYSQHGMFDHDDMRKLPNNAGEPSSEIQRSFNRQASRSEESSEDRTGGKRKRSHYHGDEMPIPVPSRRFQTLKIGNTEEVTQFYFVRFKDMQQSSCKVMGKAFVKLVEPKKQTHHPYTKGNSKAPPWWPPTSGDDSVKHKEPDHLLKPERIRLLVHILRMIVQPPQKQFAAVQKLGLDVKKLEEVTMEAMSNWFNDKDHLENAAKKPYLKEIFKVAKAEEQYLNGEIDADTQIMIMYGERSPTDDTDGEDDLLKEEEEEEQDNPMSNTISTTPDSLVSPTMLSHPQSGFETDQHSILQNRPHSGMIRTTQMHMEEPSFADPTFGRPMASFQPHSPSFSENHRRPFAATGFHSPQQTLYPGSWQNTNMISNGQLNSNYCVTSSPQAPLAPPTAPFQLPIPQIHSQQTMLPPRMPQPFDMPHSRQFDSGPALGNMRTGSLSHPNQVHSAHAYGDFIHENNSFHNEPEMKEEHSMR